MEWNSVESRRDVGMSNDSGSSSGRASWAVRLFLALSVLANVALGFGYVELRQDLDGADERIDETAADAEESIELATASALAEIPDTDQLDTDVAMLQREMRDLEKALFGVGGTPIAQSDMVGKLRQDIDFGGVDYELLRSCFNSALSNSFDNFNRYVFNDYALSYTVERC
jgi:hypothetical protein